MPPAMPLDELLVTRQLATVTLPFTDIPPARLLAVLNAKSESVIPPAGAL